MRKIIELDIFVKNCIKDGDMAKLYEHGVLKIGLLPSLLGILWHKRSEIGDVKITM